MALFHVRRLLASAVLVLGALPVFAAGLAAQAGTITGKVTNAESGRPIENATIKATVAGGASSGAVTGADGAFRLVNLADGAYTVSVSAIGFAPKSSANVRPGAVLTIAMTPRTNVLEQTVVTASRARPEKVLDAPAQILTVTSQQIEERPAVTVTDHLRATPGVDINRGGIAQANVVARGFNNAFSGSMLMLQDYRFAGVPSLRVNVPFLFTGTNEDIDRMEVLLGPASALFGPNSSNGVLHVITKSPFQSQGTTISVDGGERSVLRTGLRHAGKVNDKLAYKLSGEYMQGNDWEYNDRSEPTVFPNTANVPASRRGKTNQRDFDLQRYTGEARVDVRPREGMEAITTLGYTKVGNGIELTGANGSSQIKNWTYLSLQQRFKWNRLFAQAFLNSSDAGNASGTDDQGTFLLRSGQPIVDQSRVASAQIQHGFDLGAKQSFTYGADYIWTNPRTANTINGQNEDVDNVTEYGAYVQSSTKPIQKVELLLAARADANSVIAGQFFSPRAALILKPSENQNIRFTFNRAFSTPGNFSFFLDLIQTPNAGGSGFDVRARGNPPKEGHQFNRSCGTGSAFGSYCMRSAYASQGSFVGASAAAAFPGAIQALAPRLTPGIAGALQQAGLPAAIAQQLAAGAVQFLGTRTPTNADLATRVSYLTTATTALQTSELTDIDPLAASFNNTYEVGYKGTVGGKVTFDVALWGQERGDVGTPAALATPNVFFGNPQQLGGYLGQQLGANLGPQLAQLGLTAAQIGAIVSGVAGALTPSVASLPVGVVTFANGNTTPNAVYATYFTSAGKLWVRGMDLATSVAATDRVTADLAYSYQSQNVFRGLNGGNGLPLMSNAPNSRGSLGVRYRNDDNGLGFELRTRYNEAYPVNSGVYASNFAFPIAAGQTGAVATAAAGGPGRCSPAPAGTFCYENVPEAVMFDAQITKRFNLGENKLAWTLNATNMFDNRVRTFPGVPEMGRMIMTRLQYSF
ncbi:TonB-dependent receptor domain-containing protein [Gemmatimonas sp.]|jgi:outer membrane receptor for ferrienterochelin and colicins|uniref:TonB-dependent receptor domain-containing protein n=1 Tax=Gemmatimonas sp. TaxID=1962908 RepID=UPI0037C1852B